MLTFADTRRLHTPCPLSVNRQELCAEAPSVSPEELGEDEGETGAAEERG